MRIGRRRWRTHLLLLSLSLGDAEGAQRWKSERADSDERCCIALFSSFLFLFFALPCSAFPFSFSPFNLWLWLWQWQ